MSVLILAVVVAILVVALFVLSATANCTQASEHAIRDPARNDRNARQTMLMHKGGHGTGINPTFPHDKGIARHMDGFPEEEFIDAFGDSPGVGPPTPWVRPSASFT